MGLAGLKLGCLGALFLLRFQGRIRSLALEAAYILGWCSLPPSSNVAMQHLPASSSDTHSPVSLYEDPYEHIKPTQIIQGCLPVLNTLCYVNTICKVSGLGMWASLGPSFCLCWKLPSFWTPRVIFRGNGRSHDVSDRTGCRLGPLQGQPFPVRWVWKGGQYWPDEGEPGLGGGRQQTCQEVSSPDSAPDSGRAGCPQSNAFSALQQMIS